MTRKPKLKRDKFTRRPHGAIIAKKMIVQRGPLLDRMNACRAELHIFGYLTADENMRIANRIAGQRLTRMDREQWERESYHDEGA